MTDLADADQVFGAEARDRSFVSRGAGLCGPAEDTRIVRRYLESLSQERALAMLLVDLTGSILFKEPEEGCYAALLKSSSKDRIG